MMMPITIADALNDIAKLFTRFGHETYEEACTQLQHAQQSGALALERGLGDELALAAFLHDIGHFVARESQLEGVGPYGYPDHAELGADYLAERGFSERLVGVIREHVRVKRYLAATRAGYQQHLSHASQVTLQQQGGAMSGQELLDYRRKPLLDDAIALRELDDCGKLPEKACQDLDFWLTLAASQLRLSSHQ